MQDAVPQGTLQLAVGLHRSGRLPEAERAYRQWLDAHPGDTDANFYFAGLCLQLGRLEEAAARFRAVVDADPRRSQAWLNLGVSCKRMGDVAAAASCFAQAVALEPAEATAHYNLGVVLHDLQRAGEAVKCFDRAIALRPGYAQAYCNRGASLGVLQRDAEALADFDRALHLVSDYAEARCNRASALYRLGRFEEAWIDYESRWQRPRAPGYRHGAIRPWRGEHGIEGKRILLWCEQGYGDTLQFCRYAHRVADLGAQVILEVQPALRTLLSTLAAPVQVIDQGEALPPCDLECPLLSLPLALHRTAAAFSPPEPYLRAEPDQIARWRDKLGGSGLPCIGIACSGNRSHPNDRNRSMPLDALAPLHGKAQLFLLQTGLGDADEAHLRTSPIRDLRADLADFSDTAAAMHCMDLVISVDTALVHLAGALGKPAWILLAFESDWRWMLGRTDTPWYPAARLFRQPRPGAWAAVVREVARALDGFPEGRERG
jgi:tetratricopeptide (TPR) repeat protein